MWTKHCQRCGQQFFDEGRICEDCRDKPAVSKPRTVSPEQAQRYDAIWRELTARGMMRKADIARISTMQTGNVEMLLAAMEIRGYLMSEDERGKIHPFGRVTQ